MGKTQGAALKSNESAGLKKNKKQKKQPLKLKDGFQNVAELLQRIPSSVCSAELWASATGRRKSTKECRVAHTLD